MGTLAFLTQLLLLGLGVFLMIVILLQRGRGGGLAGAFGGLGGQSAFGTKAGDVFTKITVVIAVAWVIVAGGSGFFLRDAAERRAQALGDVKPPGVSATDDEDANADDFIVPKGDNDASAIGETPSDETAAPKADGDNATAEPAKPDGDASSAASTETGKTPAEPAQDTAPKKTDE